MIPDRFASLKPATLLTIAAALALTACGDKGGGVQPPVASPPVAATAPAALANAAPASANTPAPTEIDATPSTHGHDQEAMERHHRQEMDHAEMRKGAAGSSASPPPDTTPTNPSSSMQHM